MPRLGKTGKRRLRCLALLLLAAGSLGTTGCLFVAAGVAAGGGTAAYIYFNGNVCQEFVANFETTWKATLATLTEQGLPIVKNENDGKSGKITSRTTDNTTIHIDLKTMPSRIPAEGNVTRVCVRIGVTGDRTVSERFLERIAAHVVPVGGFPPAPPGVAGWKPSPTPAGPIRPVSAIGPAETAPPPELPKDPVPVQGGRR
jgi:hypothetical protein